MHLEHRPLLAPSSKQVQGWETKTKEPGNGRSRSFLQFWAHGDPVCWRCKGSWANQVQAHNLLGPKFGGSCGNGFRLTAGEHVWAVLL